MDDQAAGPDRGAGPLAGVVVVDFSRVVAGPYCTMLLGDLGAEVIKVESPGGDDTRTYTPPERDGVSTYFTSVNRNKRSIALDLADPADRRVAHALSARADVLVHNFMPGKIEKFELGYDDVVMRRPDVIYCAISGFGTREGAALPGYDLLIQAVSGLMSLTGEADGPPLRAGLPVFDVMTALHSAIGITAALRHRELTGTGQLIEIDLLSTALSSMVNQTSAFVAGGVVPLRMGNEHPSLYPYEPFLTAEGQLIVVAGNDRQFAVLCRVLGLGDVADRPEFASVGKRNANRAELRAILLAALSRRTAEEWFDLLTAAGLPCAPINDVAGGIGLAQRLGLDPVVSAQGPPTVRNPLLMSRTPATYRLPPPTLDSSGADIRAWLDLEPAHDGAGVGHA